MMSRTATVPLTYLLEHSGIRLYFVYNYV
uniref:Uncharacterized protein n=1 Tax=Anguilla anguilla TaxID=7936 RepID=A0A0E9VDL3_ANGAN